MSESKCVYLGNYPQFNLQPIKFCAFKFKVFNFHRGNMTTNNDEELADLSEKKKMFPDPCLKKLGQVTRKGKHFFSPYSKKGHKKL